MKLSSNEFKQLQRSLNIEFSKACTIELIKKDGVLEFFPQRIFTNINHYPYLKGIDENTPFCKFKPNLPPTNGVYLWVIDDEIIYIGEGVNLYKRFNSGYGNISPRNCFKGGQNTNIKMNRIALKTYYDNKKIDIYIFETQNHKLLEKELLKQISTPYNVRDN